MTSITRLSLQGVRSYSDAHPEVIDFHKPLTIIVGANGSGKTSIIEALKYVTTGSLPPLGDGGKTWLRDPNLDSQSTTRGQIRLSFRTKNDTQSVLAVRTFQLTQTRGQSRSFKALESVLRVRDTSSNSEQSISHRCADMDKLTPQLMGVSASILENVIFCHQSESDWPLSDSKTLKLKFDDIFSATRYTKALEAINKLKKEKSQQIRVSEAELKTTETKVRYYEKMLTELTGIEIQLEKQNEKQKVLEEKSAILEAKLHELQSKRDTVAGQLHQIRTNEKLLERARVECQSAYEKVASELNDSDTALEDAKTTMLTTKTNYATEINSLQREYDRTVSDYDSRESELESLQRQAGAYEEKQREAKRKKEEICELRLKLCSELGLSESDIASDGRAATQSLSIHSFNSVNDSDSSSSNNTEEAAFLATLERALAEKKSQLASHKAMVLRVDTNFEEQITAQKSSFSKLTEQIQGKVDQARRGVERLRALTQSNASIDTRLNSGEVEEVSARLMELDAASSNDSADSDITTALANKQRALTALQADLLVLSEEKKKLSFQNEIVTLIKVKSQEVDEYRRKHNDMLGAVQRAIDDYNSDAHAYTGSVDNSPLMDGDPDSDTAIVPKIDVYFTVTPLPLSLSSSALASNSHSYDSSQYQSALSSYKSSVKSALSMMQREHSEAASMISKLNGQLRALTDQYATTVKQIDAIKKRRFNDGELRYDASEILTLFKDRDSDYYDSEVAKLNDRLSKRESEKGLTAATITVYEKHLELTRHSHQCALCDRGFDTDDQLANLVTKMESMLNEWRDHNELDQKEEERKLELQKLKHFQHSFHDYQRLARDRQSIQAKIDSVKSEINVAEQREKHAAQRLKLIQRKERSLQELLIAKADALAALFQSFTDTLHSVDRERRKLVASRDAGARDLESVTKIVDEKERQRGELMTAINDLQSQRESAMKARESRLAGLHTLQQRQAEFHSLKTERVKNKAEIDELRAAHQTEQENVTKLKAQQAALKASCDKLEREREEDRVKNGSGEGSLAQGIASLQRELDSFTRLLDQSRHYDREVAQSALSRQSIINAEQSIKQLLAKKADLAEKIRARKERAATSDADCADVLANLEWRRRKREVVQLEHELVSLKQSVKIDANIDANIQALERNLQLAREQRAELRGQVHSLTAQQRDKQSESKSKDYRNITGEFTDRLIELQATTLAVNDLDLYGKCLDASLMHYHSVKMREINDLLRDYWRSVYRGKDIDEIFIHSSHAEDTASKRRQYTYSVMMKQGDTALEMRGRSSAGQRVLASLLIRLALADTFCLSCGVLALDEPTTNLDHRNIKAFASALHDIVEKRRAQSNFQLIVITHDEAFVEELGRRCQAETYYRVWKDEHQHSRIKQCTMGDAALAK